MTSDAEIVIGIRGEVGGARTIKRSLDDVANSGDRATREAARLEKQTQSLSRAAGILKTAFAGLIGVMGANQLRRLTDTWTTLETQLKNVTTSTREYEKVLGGLYATAQRNGDVFDGLAETYVKLNNSLPDAVRNTTDLVKVTELLSRGFAISGTNAQTAAAASLQLTQGLSSNFSAAAQELNSLIEGAPLLARIISEQLGGQSATDLKRLAEAGELTAESFLNALLAAEQAIGAYEIPPTIDRSLQRLKNSFLQLVGQSSTVQGAARNIAEAIDGLSANLEDAVKVVGILAATAIPALARVITTTLIPAFLGLTTAMLANPLFTAAALLSGAIAAIVLYRKEIMATVGGMEVFGTTVGDVFRDIGEGAKIIFGGVAAIIGGTFTGIVEVVKKAVAEAELILFKFSDKLAQSKLGQKMGIETFTPSAGMLRRSSLSWQKAYLEGAGNFDRMIEGMFQRDMTIPTTERAEVIADPARPGGPLEGLEKTTKEAKKLKQELSAADEAVLDMARDIDRDLAGAFKDAFSQTDGGFKRLMEGMKASFTDMLGEIAYQATLRPIFLNVVAGVSGAAVGSMGGSVLSGGGASGGIGGIGNLLSMGKNLFGGLNSPIFGASSMIGQGINSIGASLGLTNANFMGPMMPGTSSLSTAFTPMAGLAGFGGNMLGNMLFGNRGIGATIGGTLGSIGGTAVGASMGTILGMAGGPVGALVGGFLGNAVGGLFGSNDPGRNTLGVSLDARDGELYLHHASTKQADIEQANKFGNTIIQTLNDLAKLMGGRFDKALGAFETNIGEKDQGTFWGSTRLSNSPGDIDAIVRAVIKSGAISGVDQQTQQVLDRSMGLGTQGIVENLGILQLIKSFENTAEVASPLKTALEVLDTQFEALKNKALELSLPVDKLTEAYGKQREAIIDDVLSPLQNWLDGQALSTNSSLNPVERLSLARSSFDTNLAAIQAGDFSGLGNLTGQASQLLDIGRSVYASSEAFSTLESFVRQSVAGVAGDLGAPGGLNMGDISREISLSNAKQTSILEQINLEMQQLREENLKLRKAMERFGDAMVVRR